ncbi:HinT-interacting membrane complex protein P80 [Mycoplasma marinum]|uniref:Lipoprotein n=1 Tax=Mycoplasma marinum TaxID=1937190 RepID=A0A4V2NI02_9MOLU|nr:hypothetical protein [Mycoplasma marinum]TCG10908.1 hypothetical protein C4B24_03550 [Mycoplasma marinum]
MNKKRVAFSTLGGILTMSTVAAVAVSCGSTEETKTSEGKINLDGLNKTVEDYIKSVAQTSSTAEANQVRDILEKSISFLYEKEQIASKNMKKLREESIKDYAKRNGNDSDKAVKEADIKELESIKDITKRVKAEFDDEKDAYKNAHGYGWEKTWPAELAKNKKYSGAKSDEEAIAHLVNKQLSSSAFGEFQIDQNTTWYKADVEKAIKGDKNWARLKKLYDNGYVFSNSQDVPYDKLNDNDKVIVVSTKSYDVNKTSIKNIETDYLKRYDPMVVNHLLIKVVPDATNGFKPWKIDSLDTLKSLLMTDGTKMTVENLEGFKGLQYKKPTAKTSPAPASSTNTGSTTAGKKQKTQDGFFVSEKDEKLLETKVAGNSAGTKKIGGSLGFKDQLSYVEGMVPGFALPMLTTLGTENIRNAKDSKNNPIANPNWMKDAANPLSGIGTKLLDALAKARKLDPSATFKNEFPNAKVTDAKTWIKAVNALISSFNDDKKVLEVAGKVFRDAFSPNGEKNLIYQLGKNQMVVSKFGIHIINGFTLEEFNRQLTGAKTATTDEKVKEKEFPKALHEMVKSDVQRKVDGNEIYFNALAEIGSKSADRMHILESLLNKKDFITWLKTQTNYGADSSKISGNDYPKYTDDLINEIKNKHIQGYKDTLDSDRASKATSKLNTWLDTSHKNGTLIGQTDGKVWDFNDWHKSIEEIYNTSLHIAEKGIL